MPSIREVWRSKPEEEGIGSDFIIYEVRDKFSGKVWYVINDVLGGSWMLGIPSLKEAKYLVRRGESMMPGEWEEYVMKKYPKQGLRIVGTQWTGPEQALSSSEVGGVWNPVTKRITYLRGRGSESVADLAHEMAHSRLELEESDESIEVTRRRELEAWREASRGLKETGEWSQAKERAKESLLSYAKSSGVDPFDILIGKVQRREFTPEEEAFLKEGIEREVESW